LCSDSDAKCSIPASDSRAARRIKLFVSNTDEEGKTVPGEDKLLVDSPTYVVECIATSIGSVCTSGNKKMDMELYGEDRGALLTKLFAEAQNGPPAATTCGAGYIFEGVYSNTDGTTVTLPIQSNAIGEFEPMLEWQSCSPLVKKEFLALNFSDPNKAKNLAGSQGGQQQAQIEFDRTMGAGPTPVVRRARMGAGLESDPYGRIFDAQTLEPVAGEKVLLTKKRADGTFTPVNPYDPEDARGGSVINPFLTKEAGYFSFIVPDGTYRLSLVSGPQNTTIATDPALLKPGYESLYSDIYPLKTGEDIIQKGKIEHRDIPVLRSLPTDTKPALVTYFYDADKRKGRITLTGTASMPLAKIHLYALMLDPSGKTVHGQELAAATADKKGDFEVSFLTSVLKNGETYGDLVMEKPAVFTASSADTRTGSRLMDPILNYLEGYARDASGDALPYATVGLYLAGATVPQYRTKADAKGYFSISSEHIPAFAYTLRYTDAQGKVVSVTPLDFALHGGTANLNTYKRIKPELQAMSEVKPKTPITNVATDAGKTMPRKDRFMQILLVLLGTTIVVIIIIIGIVATIRKRQTQVPPLA